jgi:N-acetylglucosaminyldiphosphoundecaprenol N-acetyl-beta-D-mannosaminyltransferase
MENVSGTIFQDTLVQDSLSCPSNPWQKAGHPPDITPDFGRDVVCLFGLAFDRVTLKQAIDHLLQATATRQRCHLVTPNLNLLRLSRKDQALRSALLASDLSVVDGMPLVWLARWLGEGIRERVSGADLFAALGRAPSQTRVFFFGGEEAVAARLKRKLGNHTTGLRCVGAIAPGFGSLESLCEPETIRTINTAKPDLIMVAIGARKGVLWIGSNETALHAPVIANLGATIHFTAGTVKRAPESWRRSGFEWLWRIRQEPHLARRYAADFGTLASITLRCVLPQLACRWVSKPGQDYKPKRCHVQLRLEPNRAGRRLRLTGDFRRGDLQLLREALVSACRNQEDLVVDLDETKSLDASALGLLLLAHGHQHRLDRKFSVQATGWRMRAILGMHGCSFLLQPAKDGLQRALTDTSRPNAIGRSLPGIRRL